MEEIKGLLRTIVGQLDEGSERALVERFNREERDNKMEAIHSSIEGVREAVLEVEHKLDQIEMRLETIETKVAIKEPYETTR